MYETARSEVKRLRSLGWPMENAYRTARTIAEFRYLESERFARLRIVPDECPYDDSFLDCQGIPAAKVKREREALWSRIESEGVWGIIAEVQTNGRWSEVYSVFGFIGDDWQDSGYDSDAMSEAVFAVHTNAAHHWGI